MMMRTNPTREMKMMMTRTDLVKMKDPKRKSKWTNLRRRKRKDQRLDTTRAVKTLSPDVEAQGLTSQDVSSTQGPKLMSSAALDGTS
jgi:hypothetical protein